MNLSQGLISVGFPICKHTDGAVTSAGRLGAMGRRVCGRILETRARNETSTFFFLTKGSVFFDIFQSVTQLMAGLYKINADERTHTLLKLIN